MKYIGVNNGFLRLLAAIRKSKASERRAPGVKFLNAIKSRRAHGTARMA